MPITDSLGRRFESCRGHQAPGQDPNTAPQPEPDDDHRQKTVEIAARPTPGRHRHHTRRWDPTRQLITTSCAPLGAILGVLIYYGFHQPTALTQLARHRDELAAVVLVLVVGLATLTTVTVAGHHRHTSRGGGRR